MRTPDARIELPRDGGQGHHSNPDHPESTERGQWRYQHQNNTYQENRRDTKLIHSGETQSGSVTPAEAKALLQLAQLERRRGCITRSWSDGAAGTSAQLERRGSCNTRS
jgi:hypothetical protein